jgi:branched-chain amino acid transport system permease protein
VSTPQLLEAGFSGLALGSVYALVALGFAIVYQATQTFNFAQGALVAVAAYLVLAATGGLHLAFPYAAGLAIVGSTAIGVAIGELLVRPLSARSPRSPDMALIALSIVLAACLELAVGPGERIVAPPLWGATLDWRGVAFSEPLLLQTAASWLSVALVGLLLRITSLGLLIRAGQEGQEAARHADVDVAAMRRLAFAIGGFCAGVGGIILGERSDVPADLQGFAMLAIPAAAIGGLGSLRAALLGGLLIGAIQPFATAYGSARTGEFVVYVALLAVLIVRPRGLLSRREWGQA